MFFDKLILKFKAMRAFSRTQEHPAYSGVRIAYTPEDMVVIHRKGVSAVIWDRGLPPELQSAIASMDASRFPVKSAAQAVDVDQEDLNPKAPWLQDIPAEIRQDMAKLNKLFAKVCGRKGGQIINTQNADESNLEEAFRGVAKLPHTDGFGLRLGVAYSQDETAGTQWYPVKASAHAGLIREFKAAADIELLKKKYNMQQLKAGQVILFKGRDQHRQKQGKDTYPAADHFLHSGPKPKAGVFRMGYFIGL